MQRMSEQNVGNFLHLPRSAVCKVTGNESQRDKRRSALIPADLEAEQACVRQRADAKSKPPSEQSRQKSPPLAILIPQSPGHDLLHLLQPEQRAPQDDGETEIREAIENAVPNGRTPKRKPSKNTHT